MLFRTLGLCLLFVSISAFAQGRKPAVEDFIGIEVEHPEVTPQGTEPLFNLEEDLDKHQKALKETPKTPTHVAQETPTEWSLFSVVAVSLGLGLPLIMWFMILGHMRKKASLESASNIEVLEKYRKNRELSRKSEENVKKAS